MSFDLSSTLIGVSVATIDTKNKRIEQAMVMPVIPKKPTGKDLGYTTKNKKKVELRTGEMISSFLKEGEVIISKAEAKRRNATFRDESHKFLLMDIGKKLGTILHAVKPDIVMIERNEAFNGILTTKLLAEIAGGVYFWAGFFNSEFRAYNATTMRSLLNRHVKGADLQTEDGSHIVDTKMVVKRKIEKFLKDEQVDVKNFEKATLDESDSFLPIIYFLLKEVRGEFDV